MKISQCNTAAVLLLCKLIWKNSHCKQESTVANGYVSKTKTKEKKTHKVSPSQIPGNTGTTSTALFLDKCTKRTAQPLPS